MAKKFNQNTDSKNEFVHIRASPDSRTLLIELASKFNRRNYIFLDQVLTYFQKTGYDPLETDVPIPGDDLKKLKNEFRKERNAVISFIRKQESDILLPMISKVDTLVTMYIDHIKDSKPSISSSDSTQPATQKPSSSASKSGFKIPEAASKKVPNQESQESQNILLDQKLNREIDLEVQLEKAQKLNDRLRERLKLLKGKITPKSFGSGYTIDLTKSEYEEIDLF